MCLRAAALSEQNIGKRVEALEAGLASLLFSQRRKFANQDKFPYLSLGSAKLKFK